MDFVPTEEQTAAQGLAARIFGDLSTHERLAGAGTGTDTELWKELCAAGLTAAVEEIGLLGLVLLLEEQGRTTAQVPFAASCVYGLLAVASHGTDEQRDRLLPPLRDGTAVATGAFPACGGMRADGEGRLSGSVPYVPWLRDASLVLVADSDRGLWIVRTGDPGVATEPVETTAPWSAARLVLDRAHGERLGGEGTRGEGFGGEGTRGERLGGEGTRGERLGGDRAREERLRGAGAYGEPLGHVENVSRAEAYEHVLAASRIAFAGLQAGVCAGSLARAVAHTNTREQFGRPLSTKQAVLLRAADAHMDTEAIRVTAYEAAWRHDTGLPYGTQALTAAWWASEAGTRVVHAGQHLHGGTGADLDHPVHRHFLWGRQLDAYLGCGSEVLQELGQSLVKEGPE
ncbi:MULTISPECIES: acyl-CoA dehydrogenase family protein [unclassified Streptomyces]|uniref:acyl-CoA dehydrogenase family protein n=1 Tax=unclassified Streptomyces TaxID=2593676 RepID=UPI002E1076F6|nr:MULTISPECIES: acyl-CoA dehydrogenase family protein [unclassified Streptomyces]WSJ37440.1 acyl-CoA/acyl-ACP dehydrogenase [Streptomyces sp. NBC_01321]WSP56328.1 acyl-CoA/acyl-ACP dehydrogenase [Streptomyces sp. NBC_01241]WSP63837.1 acyl-CoA/acyl-ACP dehydrogenase [Streptomyces sp. NBC_01240]